MENMESTIEYLIQETSLKHEVNWIFIPFMNFNEIKQLIEEKDFDINKITTFKVSRHGNIYDQKNYDVTLLYAAVAKGDEELVDYLLSKKADPNILIGKLKRSVLERAIISNKTSIVKKLIAHGAVIGDSYKIDPRSPMYYAVYHENYDLIKCLIDYGFNVKDELERCYFSIINSSFFIHYVDYEKMTKILWENGVDFGNYKTPVGLYSCMLSEAVQLERLEQVQNLLNLNANFTYVRGDRFSILHEIVEINGLRTLMILLEHKRCDQVFIDSVVTKNNYSLLHIAAFPGLFNYRRYVNDEVMHSKRSGKDIIKIVTHILNSGIDVNIMDAKGKLPVEYVSDKKIKVIFKIKEHIVKLLAVGSFVCQGNIEAIQGPEFDNLRAECKEEVYKMEAMIGTSNLSYRKFLKVSIHQAAVFLKNVDLSEIIKIFDNKPEGTKCEIFPLLVQDPRAIRHNLFSHK